MQTALSLNSVNHPLKSETIQSKKTVVWFPSSAVTSATLAVPAARRQNMLPAQFDFIDEAYLSGTNDTGRWAVARRLLRPVTDSDCIELVNRSGADGREEVDWLTQCRSVTCPCSTPSQPKDSEHFCPSPLTHLMTCCASLPDTQSDKCTFWGVEAHTHTYTQTADHNLHCPRPLSGSVTACGCPCELLSFQTRAMIPGLLPEKQELVCSINTCMTRPIARPTCQRRACQARDGETEELLWYSQTTRPRLGFHRQGDITNHGIPFPFQFCLWDANRIKLHWRQVWCCADTWQGGVPCNRQIRAYRVTHRCWLHLSDLQCMTGGWHRSRTWRMKAKQFNRTQDCLHLSVVTSCRDLAEVQPTGSQPDIMEFIPATMWQLMIF